MHLLRPSDVAQILACSRSAVYALKDSGVLPFCKIGGLIRFREEDVTQFIEDNLVASGEREGQRPGRVKLKHLRP